MHSYFNQVLFKHYKTVRFAKNESSIHNILPSTVPVHSANQFFGGVLQNQPHKSILLEFYLMKMKQFKKSAIHSATPISTAFSLF